MIMRYDPIDKVILFGGSLTLSGLAKWLISEEIQVKIFTSPRHAEESLTNEGKTLAELLGELEVPYVMTEDINKESSLMAEITPKTLGIGIGEAWSFDAKIINAFSGKLLDFMGIPLPRYRGGAHYTWMIMSGEHRNGVRLQVINTEMIQGEFDSGEIVENIDYIMDDEELLPSHFFQREVQEGVDFISRFLSDVRSGRDFKLSKIDESKSLYLPRLNTDRHGWIDWRSWSGLDIERFIRAFDTPYKGASTTINDQRVYLKNAHLIEDQASFHPFQSGLVARVSKEEGVVICTVGGLLVIHSVTSESGKDITQTLKNGDRFFTPQKELENALLYRVDYNASGLKE